MDAAREHRSAVNFITKRATCHHQNSFHQSHRNLLATSSSSEQLGEGTGSSSGHLSGDSYESGPTENLLLLKQRARPQPVRHLFDSNQFAANQEPSGAVGGELDYQADHQFGNPNVVGSIYTLVNGKIKTTTTIGEAAPSQQYLAARSCRLPSTPTSGDKSVSATLVANANIDASQLSSELAGCQPMKKLAECHATNSANRTKSLTGRNAEEHRRLQYQVHQQLQKIYGNKLQEFEQHNQIQLQRRPANLEDAVERPVQPAAAGLLSQISASARYGPAPEVMVEPRGREAPHCEANMHQHHLHQHHQPHLHNRHLHSGPIHVHRQLEERLQHLMGQQHEESIYDVQSQRRPQQQVCAMIPEELYEDKLGTDQLDGALMGDFVGDVEADVDDDDDDDDDEPLNVGGKEDLCLVGHAGPNSTRCRREQTSTTSIMVDRKNQLDSLQLATATAAALLNVTASAAAALAAAEKQRPKQVQQRKQPPAAPAYQDIDRALRQQNQRRSQSEPYNKQAPHTSSIHNQQQQQHQQQPAAQMRCQQVPRTTYGAAMPNRMPVYASAASSVNQYNQIGQPSQRRLSGSIALPNERLTAFGQRGDRSAIQPVYGQQKQQPLVQVQQGRHYSAAAVHQRAPGQPPRAMNQRPPGPLSGPPPPPPLTLQQIESLKLHLKRQQAAVVHHRAQQHLQQQQQQQPVNNQLPARPNLQADGSPALALLHHHYQKLSSDLANNLRSAANPLLHRQQQLALLPQFALKQQAPVYGIIEAKTYPSKTQASVQHHQQQLYGSSGPFIPIKAIASAPSDASGHSNMPLILDRRLAKPSLTLVERICKIDLTLFWWCLSAICVLFIVAVITINRHVVFQSL